VISFCIPTARQSFGVYNDYPKRVHLFKPFVDSLYPQLTDPVELVISDNLTDHRDLVKFFKPYPLIQVKVVQQDNWWMRRGYPSFSQVWNEAVRNSTGDYLVILSDCVSVPPFFMEKLHKKRETGKIVQFLYHEKIGDYLRTNGSDKKHKHLNVHHKYLDPGDIRWTRLNWNRKRVLEGFSKIPWEQCFGFFSMPRDWFYRLNGFDENFEGQKELNDIEMFSRLQTLDPDAPIQFDKDMFVYHHGHKPVLNRHHKLVNFPNPVRSNYDLIYLHRQHGVTKANSREFDKRSLTAVVNAEIVQVPELMDLARARWERGLDVIKHWMNNQPIFDL
jgi:hypothetical protein